MCFRSGEEGLEGHLQLKNRHGIRCYPFSDGRHTCNAAMTLRSIHASLQRCIELLGAPHFAAGGDWALPNAGRQPSSRDQAIASLAPVVV